MTWRVFFPPLGGTGHLCTNSGRFGHEVRSSELRKKIVATIGTPSQPVGFFEGAVWEGSFLRCKVCIYSRHTYTQLCTCTCVLMILGVFSATFWWRMFVWNIWISTVFKPMKFEAAEHRCAAKCRGHGTAKVQPSNPELFWGQREDGSHHAKIFNPERLFLDETWFYPLKIQVVVLYFDNIPTSYSKHFQQWFHLRIFPEFFFATKHSQEVLVLLARLGHKCAKLMKRQAVALRQRGLDSAICCFGPWALGQLQRDLSWVGFGSQLRVLEKMGAQQIWNGMIGMNGISRVEWLEWLECSVGTTIQVLETPVLSVTGWGQFSLIQVRMWGCLWGLHRTSFLETCSILQLQVVTHEVLPQLVYSLAQQNRRLTDLVRNFRRILGGVHVKCESCWWQDDRKMAQTIITATFINPAVCHVFLSYHGENPFQQLPEASTRRQLLSSCAPWPNIHHPWRRPAELAQGSHLHHRNCFSSNALTQIIPNW